MRLKDVFIDLLQEKGIRRVSSAIKIAETRDPIQQMAVHLANGEARVCRSVKTTRYSFTLDGEKTELPSDAFVGRCEGLNEVIKQEELLKRAEKFPYILVDCSFYDLHSEKEKSKIVTQLKATLGVVRDFMWDGRFVVSGATFSGISAVYCENTASFLKLKLESGEIDKIVLLDPYAGNVFEGDAADCYIIGGIVDKSGNKKGLTGKIGQELVKEGIDFESMRIDLRGDITGVPDRINTISEIVLLSVLDGLSVEEAIRRVQSPLVARWRLKKEIGRYSIRVDVNGRVFRFVRKSDFEMFRWLNISIKDFFEVCRQMGFFVVSDRIADEIEKFDFDERKNRFVVQIPNANGK